ncbi:alginate export family protein [bacterium]|nr:alginate export family protein [bacterium]
MNKCWILILTVLFVFGITFTAYSEGEKIKVSGDINIRAINHESLDLRSGNIGGSWWMSTVRLRLDAALSDDVTATVRLLNERDWGLEVSASDSQSTDIDLDLAYVTLKKILFSPLDLIIGRQELVFGNAMIIGDPDTNLLVFFSPNITAINAIDLSERKAFDAIRATIDLAPIVIDPFYAQISEGNSVNLEDDVDLYGVNFRYNFSENNALSEIYYFVKETGKDAALFKDKVNTVGFRCSFGPNFAPDSPTLPFVLQAEIAHQTGDFPGGLANSVLSTYHFPGDRDAWATDISATLLTPIKLLPSITLLYNYRSGEQEGDLGGDYTAWDIMCENQGGGSLDNALVAPCNAHLMHIITQLKPVKDLTANIRYTHYLWDKKPLEGTALFGVYGVYILQNEEHLGDFVELDLQYAYNKEVTFGLNTGVYLAGATFNEINDTTGYRIIGSMKVTF